MTNPAVAPAAPVPAPVPGAPAGAPVTPAPPEAGAVAPAGEAVAPDDGGNDQALLAQQMSTRFSVVKRTEAEEAEGSPAPDQAPQTGAPAGQPPAPAAAPQAATVPPTSG